MNARRLFALLLIVLGVLALVYRGWDRTTADREAKIGGLSLSFQKKERVEIPVWAGVAAIAVGAGLLAVRGKS